MIVRYNNIRNKWSEEHITYLKRAYLQGCPLKRIAERLDRSVSAINKTLARHNLRTHRKREGAPPLIQPALKLVTNQRSIGTFIQKKVATELKQHLMNSRHEVSIEGVIFWLKSQKVLVNKSTNDIYYEVNGCPMSEQQLLYKANLLREELRLPIFLVSGITHM
jgi:IS30 family transposase